MKIDLYIVQKILNLLDKYKKLRTRPLVKRIEWAEFIGDKSKIVFNLKNGFKMFLYADSMLSKLIYEDFEDTEEAFIRMFLNEGDIFFDIGANVGYHTLNAGSILKDNGLIYAFEPTAKTFKRLQDNIALNNLGLNVKAMQIGLSDSNTTLTLNVSESNNDAYNSFADLKHIKTTKQQQVQVYTLKDIVEQEKISVKDIALIKIDVEGWEINVLRGMEDMFNNPDFNPCFLIEFTEENMFMAGYSCRELYKFLQNKGYYWNSYNPLSNSVTVSELKAYYPYENLIASKKPEQLNCKLKKNANRLISVV
jgi:FkbM family methyltransferase